MKSKKAIQPQQTPPSLVSGYDCSILQRSQMRESHQVFLASDMPGGGCWEGYSMTRSMPQLPSMIGNAITSEHSTNDRKTC